MTWVAAAVGSATVTLGAVEYYNANKQKKKAEALAKENESNRPTYAIPSSIESYLTDAQKEAAMGMPEDVRQRYLDQIKRTTAYALQSGVRTGGGIQGVSAAQMNMNDANANLATMDAQAIEQHKANLAAAKLNYAPYQDKAFAYNKDMPYQNNALAIRSLLGASEQNKNTALQTVTSGVNTGVSGIGTGNRTNPDDTTDPIPPTATNYYTSTPNTVQTQQQWQNSNPYGYSVPTNGAPNTNYVYGIPYETQTTSAPVAGGSTLTADERQKLIKLLGNP